MLKFPGFDKDIFKSTPEMEVEEECEILYIIEREGPYNSAIFLTSVTNAV